ncbi:Scr1 family TA system antitoxin-like transcriptional regulator [Streptomyces sp. NPDC091040]|uniref:helix-turn-helix domain-containing protein n=1 Tax=Streptomyces sp. NPDC091040 TaxID=3365972 RepID=UPI00382FC76F
MANSKQGRKRGTTWHVIGAQVAAFRRTAGLTQAALADMCRVSEDTIASIEQGRRPLHLDFAVLLDQLLETKGALQVAVAKVPQKERFPAFVYDYTEHEQSALSLLWYETQVVPGLLQTEEYARFVLSCHFPPISQASQEERLADRLDRQKLLTREPPPIMHFLLEESILRSRIGSPAMRREQLEHLRRCVELPFLDIQIVPMTLPKHAGLAGPMILLETPDHDHLGYIEGQLTNILHDDPDDVSVLLLKYGMLRSQALSIELSIRLLDDLLGER